MFRQATQRHSLSISRVLLLAIGSLIVLAGGSVLLLLRATSEHLLLNAGTKTLLRTMDVIEVVVRGQLDPARVQVESVGRMMSSPKFDLSNLEQVADVFQGALASTPQVRVLIYCDSQLQIVSVVRDTSTDSMAIEQYDGSDDETTTSMDKMLRGTEGARWGDLITADSIDRTLLNVRYPIRREGEYLGFIAAGVTTREMSRVAANVERLMGVSTYLTLGGQQVLAHPSLADGKHSRSADILFDQLNDTRSRQDPVTLHDPAISEKTDIPHFESSDVESFEFDFNDRAYAGFSRSLGDYGDPPLAIGAYCPAKLVHAPMQLLYSTAAVGLVVIAVALAIAVWVSRAIAKPVRRVSAGVASIGQLDLSNVHEMAPSRISEVDDLATSFNRMLWSLRAFSTYVPTKLANLVIQGVVGASVASEERELSVMFTDIVGFTALSEGMDAIEVADFVNEHLTLLVQCVEETGGTIDKYIGDALMAFWGAPQRMKDSSAAACRAALLMADRLKQDNHRRVAAGKQPIRLRIGIHTGPLVVGNIGAPGRVNYTVVGDTVNVAQRLESLGKQVDADAEVIALLSAATAEQLDGKYITHPEGEFRLQGKQHDVGVLRLDLSSTAIDCDE